MNKFRPVNLTTQMKRTNYFNNLPKLVQEEIKNRNSPILLKKLN